MQVQVFVQVQVPVQFQVPVLPCGYFRGGLVEESDGEVAPRGGCGPVPGPVQARRRKSGPPAQVRPTRPPGPPAQVRPTGSSTPVEKGCLI